MQAVLESLICKDEGFHSLRHLKPQDAFMKKAFSLEFFESSPSKASEEYTDLENGTFMRHKDGMVLPLGCHPRFYSPEFKKLINDKYTFKMLETVLPSSKTGDDNLRCVFKGRSKPFWINKELYETLKDFDTNKLIVAFTPKVPLPTIILLSVLLGSIILLTIILISLIVWLASKKKEAN